MNQKINPLIVAAALCFLTAADSAFAQGTAFTYQGRLNNGTNAASGSYDLTFTLYTAVSGGVTVGTSNVVNDLPISNGLFTVSLDFGASAFNGSDRWLEIAVRPGVSTGAYTNLVPRQPVSATPYALFAAGANASALIGSIPSTALSGTYNVAVTLNNAGNVFAGNGSNLTALNASQLTSGAVPSGVLSNAWKLGGNTGANPTNGNFLGTMDNQPLEFKVNNQRALRLQYANNGLNQSVNVIGGHNGNFVSNGVAGATIGGGGSAAGTNQVLSDFGTIAGGRMNTAGTIPSQVAPTVGGGENNTASGTYTTVGGGNQNVASGFDTTVSGGKQNSADGTDTTVGGGRLNIASALYSTVPGGFGNVAGGNYSFAAGRQAQATNDGTFVWADSTGANFGSTANNQFLIRASGGVAIGTNDPAGAALRVVGSIQADSYLGMGSTLTLGTADNQPLEFKVNGLRGLRLEYAHNGFYQSVNVIGGYSSNYVSDGVVGATIAGGGYFLDNGFGTTSSRPNQVLGNFGTIGGGGGNTVSDTDGTVSGGENNVASSRNSTVGGGSQNTAGGDTSTVGGGYDNVANGLWATIPGGDQNATTSQSAFAAGHRAKANHQGAFVWADSTEADFSSTANNQFLIRASGGVAIGTNDAAGAALRVAGTVTADGVGIGTGSPGQSLDVVVDESAKSYGGIRVQNINPTFGGERTVLFDLLNNDPSSAVTYRLQNVGNVSGRSGNFEIYQLGGVAGGARLAITTNGNVGIGRTPTANKLEVEGNASKTAAGSWLANSDRRIKQDIAPVAGALDKLNHVRLVSFRYTDEYRAQHPSIEDRPYLNVIAQEFAKVFPDAVKSSGEKLPDGSAILQVDTYPLTIYSAAAIQDLNKKVDSENAKLREALKQKQTEVTELKQRLEKLEQLVTQKLNGEAR